MDDTRSPRDARRFDRRLKEARIGDPVAQYDIGLMYANGVGVERNVEEALVWFKAASRKGHANAQYLLGSAYASGVGTERDELAAVQWFLKAAEQGSDKALFKLAKLLASGHATLASKCFRRAAEQGLAEAQLMMGHLSLEGDPAAREVASAKVWYQKAADQGNPYAQFALGQLYAEGQGVAMDKEQAAVFYRMASAQGHAAAQWALEQLDLEGFGRTADGKPKVRKAAVRERRAGDSRWVKAAEGGDAGDRYHLGLMYQAGVGVDRNPGLARLWFQRAASQGHAMAQLALARMCEPSEPELAVSWYEKAAHQGQADAQFALGRLCETGVGTDRDVLRSVVWYAKAAEQEHPEALLAMADVLGDRNRDAGLACYELAARQGEAQAQFWMGEAHRVGAVLPQDVQSAVRWFRLAAEQEHPGAQCALAELLVAGQGVEADLKEAMVWYAKAAAQNFPRAQWCLGSLYAAGGEGLVPDPKKASLWCKKAANAGYVPAQATLGNLFSQAKKHDRAALWWSKAEAQGDLEARFNLATALRLGKGVAVDRARAFVMMLSVAESGIAAAQAQVGLMYVMGEGVALDPIEAMKWFLLASYQGDELARANGQRAKERFELAQCAEAERRARAWLDARQK